MGAEQQSKLEAELEDVRVAWEVKYERKACEEWHARNGMRGMGCLERQRGRISGDCNGSGWVFEFRDDMIRMSITGSCRLPEKHSTTCL